MPSVIQTTTDLADQHNVVLTKLIEKHAPLQTCRVADRTLVPRHNEKQINAKQIRQQLEWKWRHTSRHMHREMYKTQCVQVKSIIKEAKSHY